MDGVQLVGVVTGVVLVVVAGLALVLRGRRRRERRREADRTELDRLATAAGSALVRTDERARLAEDELSFAVAELGEPATAEAGPALRRAREHLREAFHLNQLLHDHVPDTDVERREWSGRIVELCRTAGAALDDLDAGLADRRRAARSTPEAIDRVEARVAAVREAVGPARADVERLRTDYTDHALAPVADNPAQAGRLLDFAARSAATARRRLASQQVAEAVAGTRAAEESVLRAEGLLAAVDGFEAEALQAEAALGALVAESRTELAQARAMPATRRRGAVDLAADALEEALRTLPGPGDPTDPVAALTRLRQANTALDDAVRDRIEQDERSRRASAQRGPALDDAARQVAAARALVDDYRAPVGPDARTRLAEAERELTAARNATHAESAVDQARRAAALAAEAAELARRDVSHAGHHQPWDGRRPAPAGRAGSGAFGAVLGGMVLGGILDEIGDLGDLFD
ncbi:hypothetical protein MWU57_00015 [Isoptericola sp. S6320L]|uniref:hypothetical protein n=1 Tax=Isoptericola sp. S6320L TaxID=2926411 RepID=UPI001FF529F6|nr:hypothetical protein [Isoptericola sp. S6320L]MCK0115406.1 hypothetical protein [Isoptericola sp. S6320L]